MCRNCFLSLCFFVSAVSPTFADLPLPWHDRYVDPHFRFEGIEDYSDHVFFVRFLSFSGGPSGVPHSLVEVKNSEVFRLGALRRIGNVILLAMDRSEFDRRAKEDPSLQWLNDKTDGVQRAILMPPATVGSIFGSAAPVTAYRITLTSRRLDVEDITPMNWMPIAVGGFAAISLILFGIWFVRRRKSPGV